MLVVCSLREGPIRTGALRRCVDGVSQKMLTQTLRDLERHGIVKRISYDEIPPRVEYKLTRLGQSLSEVVEGLERWVVSHYSMMAAQAHAFDAQEVA